MKFVPTKGPINNIPALVQIMAWHRPGNKSLSEPMMARLLTHLCIIRPQWVNSLRSTDVMWHHRSLPTLIQLVACCLMAPIKLPADIMLMFYQLHPQEHIYIYLNVIWNWNISFQESVFQNICRMVVILTGTLSPIWFVTTTWHLDDNQDNIFIIFFLHETDWERFLHFSSKTQYTMDFPANCFCGETLVPSVGQSAYKKNNGFPNQLLLWSNTSVICWPVCVPCCHGSWRWPWWPWDRILVAGAPRSPADDPTPSAVRCRPATLSGLWTKQQ